MSVRQALSTTAQGGEVRELRLAVVLYGGASLAIYMHGTTKELQRLVKASALAERGGAATTASERVYGELLTELAGRDPAGVRTRVVVDVVAGTSAGGINGVYLSKALAHNRSQDSLRDLWLERGDIKVLLRGPAWLPALLKVPLLLAGAVKKPVLKGDAIAQWMYGALRDMDRAGSQPAELETLMPPSHPLELFVTVTDFHGYRRDVAIADPKLIGERAHRHVLAFRLGDGVDQFDEAHNGALAFSARTTMSFPGAFPPVSLASFQAAVAKEAGDVSPALPELFRIYELAHADPHATFFIDGGVLDNKPFGYAIAAIKRRAAESEVKRRLLYLEPDPGGGGRRRAGRRLAEPDRDRPGVDLGPATCRSRCSTTSSRSTGTTSASCGSRRSSRRPSTRSASGSRRSSAPSSTGSHASSRRPTSCSGAPGSTRTRRPPPGFALRDLPPQQGECRRRQLRADDLPPLRLPGRLQPGDVRARRRPLLGRHAPATDADGRQAPADDLVAFLRTFDLAYRRAPAALRHRRPQRVVRARRRARLPDARAARRRQAHALGRAGAARRRDGRPEAARRT